MLVVVSCSTDPIYFIPLFFSSDSTATRIAICLFVHPLLLEAGEALGRGTKSDAVARRLRSGKIKTFEEAAEGIVMGSNGDMGFKLIMAFYRRFMLLNMGSSEATLFAVVAASIEEARVLPYRRAKRFCQLTVPILTRCSPNHNTGWFSRLLGRDRHADSPATEQATFARRRSPTATDRLDVRREPIYHCRVHRHHLFFARPGHHAAARFGLCRRL